MGIREKFHQLQSEIQTLKTAKYVRLIAVTKFASAAQMIEAFEAGITDFGENKVQDALDKRAQLPPEIAQAITWHFIGHLQSNKVNKVVGNFDWIHSVDSLALAEKINHRAAELGLRQKILVQVNIAREEQKHGFVLEESGENLIGDFSKLISLPNCDVQGLMTIAALSENIPPAMVFTQLRDLRDRLTLENSIPLPELSMGMSQDFTHALQSGATMIRVGSYLFQP